MNMDLHALTSRVMYPSALSSELILSLQIDVSQIFIFYAAYLVVVCFSCSVGFIVFGLLIYKRLTKTIAQQTKTHGDTHRLRTLTLVTVSISVLVLITTIAVAVIAYAGADFNTNIEPCVEYSLEGCLSALIIYVTRPPAPKKEDESSSQNSQKKLASDSEKMDDEFSTSATPNIDLGNIDLVLESAQPFTPVPTEETSSA